MARFGKECTVIDTEQNGTLALFTTEIACLRENAKPVYLLRETYTGENQIHR